MNESTYLYWNNPQEETKYSSSESIIEKMNELWSQWSKEPHYEIIIGEENFKKYFLNKHLPPK